MNHSCRPLGLDSTGMLGEVMQNVSRIGCLSDRREEHPSSGFRIAPWGINICADLGSAPCCSVQETLRHGTTEA